MLRIFRCFLFALFQLVIKQTGERQQLPKINGANLNSDFAKNSGGGCHYWFYLTLRRNTNNDSGVEFRTAALAEKNSASLTVKS